MNIEIRRLTPDLAEDYVRFFDETPHNHKRSKAKCYCVYWSGEDTGERDFTSKAKRREYALASVQNGGIQGYLAYLEGEVVGWCNANTKADYLKCMGWRGMNGKRKGFLPTEEETPQIKVKSVFCFAIAPKMWRQGIATRLLARVCQDATDEGFDFVEAYPDREVNEKSEDFVGYAGMYEKMGFAVYHETNRKTVMRKALK